ncbi:MAG: hypothetical protein Q9160_006661 [Pyrenula sp. 1 TL-2023]
MRLIQELNDSLTRSEITQLKEMLMWIIYADDILTIECMLEILLLRTGLKPRQLEAIVTEKYSQLLEVVPEGNDTFIKLRSEKSDDVEDAFSKVPRPKKVDVSETDNDPRITMSININNAKLSKVQRFLWDLSEKVVLDKFEFTKSFSDEQAKCATNDSLESSEETQIVRNLVDVLHTPSYIEQHLSLDFIECWNFWLLDDFGLPAIEWWLQHAQATSQLSRPEIRWLKQVNDGRRASVLQKIAVTIARQWLRERKFPAWSAYDWIAEFLKKNEEVQKETSAQGEESLESSKEGRESDRGPVDGNENIVSKAPLSPLEAIQKAADWAQEQLSVLEDKDAMWFERLGDT